MELIRGRGKEFCKNIGGHVRSRFVFQFDGTLRNLMPNKMVLNVNVFHVSDCLLISCKGNCTLIIFIDGCWVMKDEIKVLEKAKCP